MKINNRFIAAIVGLLVLMVLIYYFQNIVWYVLLAWVVALLGQPIMRFLLEKLPLGRWSFGKPIAALLTLLTFGTVVGLMIYLFVPRVLQQAGNIMNVNYQDVLAGLSEPIGQVNQWLVKMGVTQPGEGIETHLGEALATYFRPGMVGDLITGTFSTAGSLLAMVFSVVFIAFYFLQEESMFGNLMVMVAPPQYEEKIRLTLTHATELLTRYFGGIVIQIFCVTLIVFTGLSIISVPNALLIAVFAAFINVIPFVGPILGASFGIFLTISWGIHLDFYDQMLPLLLKVVVVFAVMQMVDNFILQPLIFSKSVLAHPLEIFIVILMGARINGVFGMILAIPVYTILRVIAKTFLSEFKIVQQLTSQMKKEGNEF